MRYRLHGCVTTKIKKIRKSLPNSNVIKLNSKNFDEKGF